jgi:acyl-CoA thioester hydrolase
LNGAVSGDPYRFFHRLRVRWGECDMQGIVFNPRYMEYVDAAFTEYWRTIGMPYPEAFLAGGTDTFMVAAQVNYRDAARFDDELDIGIRTEYFGTTSFRIGFSIRRDGAALVDGAASYVNGNKTTRAPLALPLALIQKVLAFERTPPQRKQ